MGRRRRRDGGKEIGERQEEDLLELDDVGWEKETSRVQAQQKAGRVYTPRRLWIHIYYYKRRDRRSTFISLNTSSSSTSTSPFSSSSLSTNTPTTTPTHPSSTYSPPRYHHPNGLPPQPRAQAHPPAFGSSRRPGPPPPPPCLPRKIHRLPPFLTQHLPRRTRNLLGGTLARSRTPGKPDFIVHDPRDGGGLEVESRRDQRAQHEKGGLC